MMVDALSLVGRLPLGLCLAFAIMNVKGSLIVTLQAYTERSFTSNQDIRPIVEPVLQLLEVEEGGLQEAQRW